MSLIFTVIFSWFVLVASILLLTWIWPTTATGWVVTFVAGPIVYIIFEMFSELFQQVVKSIPIIGKLHSKYENEDSGKSISIHRMGYLFLLIAVVGLLFISISIVSQKYVGGVLEPISMFLKNNYK